MIVPSSPDSPDPATTERPRLPLLHRREIEAEIVGPLVRAMVAEIGQSRALDLVRGVISELARQSGAGLAQTIGDASLSAFAQSLDLWKEEGALEIDLLEKTPDRLSFNVTRCRYAEMYQTLGLGDLGASLSCQRDFALIEGFNPRISLTRTQTIMQGAPFCDFRFQSDEEPQTGPLDIDFHKFLASSITSISDPASPFALRRRPAHLRLSAQVDWTF